MEQIKLEEDDFLTIVDSALEEENYEWGEDEITISASKDGYCLSFPDASDSKHRMIPLINDLISKINSNDLDEKIEFEMTDDDCTYYVYYDISFPIDDGKRFF